MKVQTAEADNASGKPFSQFRNCVTRDCQLSSWQVVEIHTGYGNVYSYCAR